MQRPWARRDQEAEQRCPLATGYISGGQLTRAAWSHSLLLGRVQLLAEVLQVVNSGRRGVVTP